MELICHIKELITGSNLKGSSILALQFGTEELTFGSRLEIVIVSKSSIVGESNTATLLSVIVISEHYGLRHFQELSFP